MSVPSKQSRSLGGGGVVGGTAAAAAAAAATTAATVTTTGDAAYFDGDFRMHPTSKWQEPYRDDDLTLWELHRKPRKLIHQNRQIRCPLKMLNPEFRCVICLGYLQKTTMVMVCLHRFCGECINKCIRFGMKECPSCRKPIPSRRSLRRDANFDKIVQNMVGSASQQRLEDDQYANHDTNKMLHLQRAIQKKKSITERQKQRTAELKQKQQWQHSSSSGGGGSTFEAAAAALGTSTSSSLQPTTEQQQQLAATDNHHPRFANLEPSPLLELELRRHPNEGEVDRLDKGYLTVRADAKVSLLKTFLSQKLKDDTVYEITSTLDDDSVVLDDDMALMHAQETLCPNMGQVMVLKYKTTTNSSAGNQPSSSSTTQMPPVRHVDVFKANNNNNDDEGKQQAGVASL